MARKYFYAGGQRLAMRENGTLVYLFGDHLGSTSLAANRDGTTKAQQLYKAFGEKRFPSGASTLPTTFRFTGQRESSTGLYYYRARYYDPLIGRFIQADSIVPNAGDPASFDRYAYVRNSPVNFVDPSGHNPRCGPDGVWCDNDPSNDQDYFPTPGSPQDRPEKVDVSKLTKSSENIPYSGEMMNTLYIKLWEHRSGWWWAYYGTDGYFTIDEFMELILAFEFSPYENGSTESDSLSDQFIDDLNHAGTKWFWCSPNGDTNKCTNLRGAGRYSTADILNWLGGMESARRRYADVFTYTMDVGDAFLREDAYLSLASDVTQNILYPTNMAWSSGTVGLNEPFSWANAYLYPNFSVTGKGSGYNQFFQVFGTGMNAAYIFSACQIAYQKGDMVYLDRFCR